MKGKEGLVIAMWCAASWLGPQKACRYVYIVIESPEVTKGAASCAGQLALLFAITVGLIIRTEGHEKMSVPRGQRTWINFKPFLGPAGKAVADLTAGAGLATCCKNLRRVSHTHPPQVLARELCIGPDFCACPYPITFPHSSGTSHCN